MGSVSLLTRKGSGDRQAHRAGGEGGHQRRPGLPADDQGDHPAGGATPLQKVKPKELVPELEDEDEYFFEEEFNVQRILALIDQIRKLDERNRQLREKLPKAIASAKPQLEKKLRENKDKIILLLKDINLKTKHIDKIVQKLKGLSERVEKAEGEIQEVLNLAHLPWTNSKEFCG